MVTTYIVRGNQLFKRKRNVCCEREQKSRFKEYIREISGAPSATTKVVDLRNEIESSKCYIEEVKLH